MILRLWRAITQEEKEQEIQENKKYQPSKLSKEIKCQKVTLFMVKMDEYPFSFINGIHIDDYSLKGEEFEDLDYIQVFKKIKKE